MDFNWHTNHGLLRKIEEALIPRSWTNGMDGIYSSHIIITLPN